MGFNGAEGSSNMGFKRTGGLQKRSLRGWGFSNLGFNGVYNISKMNYSEK